MTRRLEVDENGLAVGGFYDDIEGVETPSNWIEAEQAGIGVGWTWDGSSWVAPEEYLISSYDLRQSRDHLLRECDYITSRHSEQLSLGVTTTLTNEVYSGWLVYRQALRDMTTDYIPTASPEYPLEPE
tara:strand:- start:363 stop:746 length:384 start_codon:yes stop_codon:yes gene_type:complete